MADADLEAIKQARLQELQSQGGGGQGGGQGGGKEEDQKCVNPAPEPRLVPNNTAGTASKKRGSRYCLRSSSQMRQTG